MIKNKHKIISAVLAAVAVMSAASVSAADISPTRSYNGQFSDVSASAWYYDSVSGAYSLGLISGVDDTHFSPDGTITIAQAVKLAASCHQLLTDGKTTELAGDKNWYDGYLSYAEKNGIVTEEYDSYTTPATRGQIAVLFSRAIISSGSEFEEINPAKMGDISDVSADAWYAGAVYRMYRWGIMTGNGGKINPEGTVKRSEISAVVMRIAYPDERVNVSSPSSGSGSSSSQKPAESTNPSTTSLELYKGSVKEQQFSGITAVAARFKNHSGVWSSDASYSLELVNNVVLESDNISFRLYKNSGYEALGIVRGWLNDDAVGQNGKQISTVEECYSDINSVFYLFIDEERVTVREMWYADHDEYTTYAFYFDNKVSFDNAVVIDLLCGKADANTLSLCGLSDLSSLVDAADKNISYNGSSSSSSDSSAGESESYATALADAKKGADIMFEQKNSRCTVLYGSGLYNTGADEYRLVFIYPNGTAQTVTNQRLASIRMSEDVLYYTMTAPDGQKIQYGVNFGG